MCAGHHLQEESRFASRGIVAAAVGGACRRLRGARARDDQRPADSGNNIACHVALAALHFRGNAHGKRSRVRAVCVQPILFEILKQRNVAPPAGKAVTLSLTAGDDDDDEAKEGGAGGGPATSSLTLTAAQLAPCSGAECAERVGEALCALLASSLPVANDEGGHKTAAVDASQLIAAPPTGRFLKRLIAEVIITKCVAQCDKRALTHAHRVALPAAGHGRCQ